MLIAVFSFGGAYGMTGQELLDNCTKGGDFCTGYIWSNVDRAATDADSKKWICVPNGVTSEQGKKVVVKYLENHPEKLHWVAWGLAHNALLEAFPCSKR